MKLIINLIFFDMKNYYFVIGKKNLMVVEAVKLLIEHKLPFKCLEAPYIFTKDEEDELIAQGFVPYYVGVAYRDDMIGCGPCWSIVAIILVWGEVAEIYKT